MRREVLRLAIGFKKFRDKYFDPENDNHRKLDAGQSPKTLIIACSDSRVDPAILTSAAPGDIFVVRNVANLVPPFEEKGGVRGVSSAIEFAVVDLKVENVIVMGHRQCGGIRALMLGFPRKQSFVADWVQVAKGAKTRVLEKFKSADEETLCRECEKESIVESLKNLQTFPFIREAIKERNLNLLGIYFDLEQGQIFEYDEADQQFKMIPL